MSEEEEEEEDLVVVVVVPLDDEDDVCLCELLRWWWGMGLGDAAVADLQHDDHDGGSACAPRGGWLPRAWTTPWRLDDDDDDDDDDEEDAGLQRLSVRCCLWLHQHRTFMRFANEWSNMRRSVDPARQVRTRRSRRKTKWCCK